jgi:ankyrin repeat protein
MIPKTEDEILDSLKDLSPDEMLLKCAENNYRKGVEIALEKGADINTKNNDGYTSLMLSILISSKNIVDLLIEKGADVNLKDKKKNNALQIAIGHSFVKPSDDQLPIMDTLLDAGIDILNKNKYGYTALYLAITKGKTDVVDLLLEYGAWKDRNTIKNTIEWVRQSQLDKVTISKLISSLKIYK